MSDMESLLERIAQAAQEGAAAAEWNGELLAKLLDEVRTLTLLVQAPSLRAEPLPEAIELEQAVSQNMVEDLVQDLVQDLEQRADQLPQDAPERLLEVDRVWSDLSAYAHERASYQARLGQMSDGDLAAEVSRGRQADREQRHRQQMREAGIQQKPAKSST